MDYIEDSGCIREETFDRIVASIEKGECPHFSAAPLERTNETSVSAIHIAAATGCMAAFNDHLCHLRYMKSRLFNFTPYAIAAIKGKSECIGLFFYKLRGDFESPVRILNAKRSTHNQDVIKVKEVSLLEFCVKKKDLRLLNSILCQTVPHSNFHKSYELTHTQNLTEMREALIEYDKACLKYRRTIVDTGNIIEGSSYAIPAIVCNQPEVLNEVLHFPPPHKLSRAFQFSPFPFSGFHCQFTQGH